MEDEMETVITQGTMRMKITQVVNGYGLHIRDSIKVLIKTQEGPLCPLFRVYQYG